MSDRDNDLNSVISQAAEVQMNLVFFFQTCDKTRYRKSFEKQSTCGRRERGHVDESKERLRVEICVSGIEQLLLFS